MQHLYFGARMLEASIFCVIGLAFGYWLILWLLSRRKDLLHGHFVAKAFQATLTPAPTPPERPSLAPEHRRALLNSIERDLEMLSAAN